MEFFTNDLSIHEQFHDISSFRESLERLMTMRKVARRFGSEVHCDRTLLSTKPIPNVTLQQALGRLANSERRSAMIWLTRGGPFWDKIRQHGADDYLECNDEIVTDSGVGEAAYRVLHEVVCALVSVTPSNWDFSPVQVTWRRKSDGLNDKIASVENCRDVAGLEEILRDNPPPLRSWGDLRDVSTNRFRSLTFAGKCFHPLVGIPFSRNSADRILFLLDILDQFARAFDADGTRTSEGHWIYQNYFTGRKNALFSDSSDKEKNAFQRELTFPCPDNPDHSIPCTWHGKVPHMTLRLHFSWPIRFRKPVYLVYVGPKITKR